MAASRDRGQGERRGNAPPMPAPRATFVVGAGRVVWEVVRGESGWFAEPCPGRAVVAPLFAGGLAGIAGRVGAAPVPVRTADLDPNAAEPLPLVAKPETRDEIAAAVRRLLADRVWADASDAEISRVFGFHRRTIRRYRRELRADAIRHGAAYSSAAVRIVRSRDGREYRLPLWYQRERAAAAAGK